MAGAGIRAIQEALGHKSIAMTVRYSHLSPDFIQDAVDRLVPQQQESPLSIELTPQLTPVNLKQWRREASRCINHSLVSNIENTRP